MPHKEIPDRDKTLLKSIADHFDQEDRAARERQLRTWRRLKLVWEGFTRIWYSEVAHDWRIWDEQINSGNYDEAFYDRPVNVFRAYLESIIAALSITVPPIKCYPDDADNPLDLSTAKAGDKIAKLIFRHNDASLMWIHALYVLCTEGMIACYSYPKEDFKYGTYEENEYKDETEEAYVCPICNDRIADEVFTNRVKDEFMPDDDDIALHDAVINKNLVICPQCGSELDPNLEKSPLIVTRLVGTTTKPKSRIHTEVYGGLYVKIPNYAMKQQDIPYLIFAYETHYSNAIEQYPELKDKFDKKSKIGSAGGGMYDPYEQWARLSPQYQGEYPLDTVTVRNCWLRPCSYNVLPEQDDVDYLKGKYPDGAKIILVNDCTAHCENESLDDSWTLSHNPLSDYIHHDPLGLLLTSIQDITNTIISLVLQTIEHGIPQTWADPSVVNFDKYKQSEVSPGAIYPIISGSTKGKALGEYFFDVRTATLSPEVLPFFQKIQELGQIVSGALPSLFGGQVSGSRTASEYSMSRAQAIQRLQNNWKMLIVWWKQIFGKVIPMYIKEMKDDERSVETDENGNFINVFIRKAEVEGKIGRVELEADENLPITWSQQKDIIMQLLESTNPQIVETLASPENLPFIREAIGLTDFTIPGEDDRQKQYEEIKMLINSEPIIQPPDPTIIEEAVAAGNLDPTLLQSVELPSVEIDPIVDNHEVEAEICRKFLVSEAGRLAKTENPMGYKNILLHMKAHMDQIAMAVTQQQVPEGQPQTSKRPGTNTLEETENVATE